MPVGIERLNARERLPNERIIFIKALDGPDKDIAEDFLKRVAAIAVPIMKSNHLSIMTLEEHEPNLEFVGRNFNGGEIVQLCLKAPYSGRWLPFRYVQSVFMHELAHNDQMNHSKYFWKLRNQYMEELKQLWAKNYTGEGFFGRGQTLYSGQYTEDAMPATDQMPEHLCGGTYRSSRRGKRKRKGNENLTYAERKQRRIEKKFGKNGVALGSDLAIRVPLENGKSTDAQPRVAKSKRGRELRAAAALARMAKAKQEEIKEDEEESSDEEFEWDASDDEEGQAAVDKDGNKLLDSKGNTMIKVCEDGDPSNDADAQNELAELRQIGRPQSPNDTEENQIREEDISTDDGGQDLDPRNTASNSTPASKNTKPPNTTRPSKNTVPDRVTASSKDMKPSKNTATPNRKTKKPAQTQPTALLSVFEGVPGTSVYKNSSNTVRSPERTESKSYKTCKVCTLENGPYALVCGACESVLGS